MKEDYKSSQNRLVKYFEESRNKWKERSLIYQKEKRELLIQKRDLERSKEKWKKECIQAKAQIEELKKKVPEDKGFSDNNTRQLNPSTIIEKVPNHCFEIWQIQLSVRIFFNTNSGFRGVSTIYAELCQFINIDTVSYGCVRQWILRLGLGLLQEPIDKRKDWIYIADFSIQLGKERCLLILGLTKQSLIENGYVIKHQQVRVLDIYVQEHFDGQKIYEHLLLTSQKTGIPYQIISDKGKDISKGIEMFYNENKSIITTNDVSHMIGVVLKHHIEKDIRWENLQEDLLSLTQQVKQTEMSFLRPIAMSSKARWLNLDKEVG